MSRNAHRVRPAGGVFVSGARMIVRPPLPDPDLIVDPRIGARGPRAARARGRHGLPGVAFGADVAAGGDLVVNTSQTGYQEVCTDPSYAGQVVVMTYPLIGNYGRLRADDQSERPWLRGLVVATATAAVLEDARQLAALLRDAGIPAIAGIDTRALARHLRAHGSLRGILTAPGETDPVAAVAAAARRAPLGGPGLRRPGLSDGGRRGRRRGRGARRTARRDRRLRPQGEHRAEPAPTRRARSRPAVHGDGRDGARAGDRRRRPLARPRRSGPSRGARRAGARGDRRRPPAAGDLPGPPDRGARRRRRDATPAVRPSRREPSGPRPRDGPGPGDGPEPRGHRGRARRCPSTAGSS